MQFSPFLKINLKVIKCMTILSFIYVYLYIFFYGLHGCFLRQIIWVLNSFEQCPGRADVCSSTLITAATEYVRENFPITLIKEK